MTDFVTSDGGTQIPFSVRFSERCCGDPDLLKVEVFDLRCPLHGLAATLRECVTADRSAR